jgi:WD40 repeat protein
MQDTLKMATGAQDGIVKIFDTCQPTSAPVDIKVSASIADGISKIHWGDADDSTIIVAKKNGTLEKWDVRDPSSSPAQAISLVGSDVVIDVEVSLDKDTIIAASGKHVRPPYSLPSICF